MSLIMYDKVKNERRWEKRKLTMAEKQPATESAKSTDGFIRSRRTNKCITAEGNIRPRSTKNRLKTMKQKQILFMAALLLAATYSFAQGNGMAGITQATSMVTSYFDPATKLIYAIGAVVGLIGGIKVYGKFSSGDPDTSKTAASWFGACIFLIVSATILRSFFL